MTHVVRSVLSLTVGRRRRKSGSQRIATAAIAIGSVLFGAGAWSQTGTASPEAAFPVAPRLAPPVSADSMTGSRVSPELPAPIPTSIRGTAIVAAMPPIPSEAIGTTVVSTTTTTPTAEGAPDPRATVVGFALDQVGLPYVRGAAGPSAYDCSGLVLAAYRQVGIALPHWSVSQADAGRAVDWQAEPILPGDLVFTRGDTPVIDLGHVGIALGDGRWVSAPRPGGQVHVVPMPTDAIQRVRRLLE